MPVTTKRKKKESLMEIRMAYPNEINRIMEIIQDGKDSLAAAGVDQWQDGYPDQEIIFEDILERESRSRSLCRSLQGK